MEIILADKRYANQAANLLLKAFFGSFSQAKKEIEEKIKSRECYLAIKNNRIVGMFLYARNYSHYANYLEELLVQKKYRRKGIAMALLEKFVEISKKEQPKKQRYVLSSTNKNNKASINMHLKFGFKKSGIVHNLHYGNDEMFFVYKLR